MAMTKVDERRLYATDNAAVWAEEFNKVCPEVDEGLMIGWFANAIESAKDRQANTIKDLKDRAEASEFNFAALHDEKLVLERELNELRQTEC